MNKYFIGADDEVEQALEILGKEEVLACDTEFNTKGFNYGTAYLWSVQLGTRNDAFLFPYHALSESSKALLRTFLKDKTIIAHFAKSDYEVLTANGFEIGKVYCTYEAEKYLFAGKYFTWSLKDVLKRRFQIEISKDVRKVFYNDEGGEPELATRIRELGAFEAWSEDIIEYALEDIVYLHEIYDAQMEDARQLGLTNVAWLENMLVPVVGDMELRGVRLDDKAVKKFKAEVLLRRDELRADIFGQLEKSFHISWQKEYVRKMKLYTDWQVKHREVVQRTNSMRNSDDKRKKSEEAKKLVAESLKLKPFSKPPEQNGVFSPTSPQKLMLALSELTGLNITTTGKEWIDENVSLHPAIETLSEFRKFEKLVQFCDLVEEINPVTGLIHAEFNQNGTKARRFSCVPMEAKALTKYGWKGCSELEIGEEILAYDMKTKRQVWTPLLAKTMLSNQPVGSIGTENRKLRSTSDHNWVVLKGHDTKHKGTHYEAKESLVSAKDVKFGHRIVMNAPYHLSISLYTAVSKTWEQETVEDVWCPTTKYGTWVMRQGDLITITGNCSNPNLQQIPARTDEAKKFRALFKAKEGYKLVGADLAGIELVILAYFSGEDILIDAINSDKDLHCFTMSQFLSASYATILKAKNGEELTELEDSELTTAREEFESSFSMPRLKEVVGHTKWVKTLRDYTKTMTYGAVYGLTPYGLSIKFHSTYEVAEQFLKLLFTSYPNLKGFLHQQEELGYERGYAVNPLGGRRWFSIPKRKSYAQIEAEVIKDLDKQKRLWDSVTDFEWQALMEQAIKQANKEYNGKIGYIKRQAGNFFPQSLCAEMIKLAMVLFSKDFAIEDKSEGLCLTIHDELIATAKEENSKKCADVLKSSMEKAVKKFMPDILVNVDVWIEDYWKK